VTSAAGVPKTIYSLWLQGLDAAPELVRFNLERWTALNPDYQLKVLDRRDALELFEGTDFPIRELPKQALSDVVRARLLRENGGVWVDASVFPVKPLSQWLDDALAAAGFFAFERPGPDRPISSWFLVAAPQNLILREWWKQIERFWSKPRRLIDRIPADPVGSVSPNGANESDQFPYFWFHYLFQYLLDTNAEFAETWDKCPRMGAGPPHRLAALFAKTPNPSIADMRAAASVAPMQKLVWRTSYPLGVLAYIDVSPGARNVEPEKHAIDLLLAEVERDPEDAPSVFSLAESYFGLGDFATARKWYTRRAEMGGSDEHAYFALFRVAQAMEQLGEPWPDVEDAYLKAWAFRPTRAEPLHAIAFHYRATKQYQLGYQFAQRAAEIPLPEQDTLFVRPDIHGWRAIDEQAICASWIGEQTEAFALCRRLLARPDIPDGDRQRIARNRDFSVPAMIEAASPCPDALVGSLVAGPLDAEVTVTLVAGPDHATTEQTLNSFLRCCTDVARVGRFLVVYVGMSALDRARLRERAMLRKRYGFLEFADCGFTDGPGAQLAQLRNQIHGRFWLHLGHGWRFFAPENFITRLTAVLETEAQVFQVGINFTDAAKLTGTCAAEETVRRAPDAGRYVLADVVASGPAMFDTARLDQAGGVDGAYPDPIATLGQRAATAELHTATLDEVLCITAV
jgi:tetratricopeptide (TPR) repeat protein